MNEVTNSQEPIVINLDEYKSFIEEVLRIIPHAENKTLTVSFVSDEEMRSLNRTYRDRDITTDVLSFPFEAEDFERSENFLGDVVISSDQAARQAAQNGLSIDHEVNQLILHGALHLVGYNHENDQGQMNSLELKLRDKLGIS